MGITRHSNSVGPITIVAVSILVLGFANPVIGALSPGGCVDFESLVAGTITNVPGTFADSGVTMTTGQYQWPGGTWTSAGSSVVTASNLSGGMGNDVNLNNINLEFDFGRPVEDLRFFFGEYGGNINLEINGDFRNESNFSDLHGLWVGGTLVEVVGSSAGLGVVRISGVVTQFAVGGQELWIDNVCDATTSADCVEFEDQPFPHSFYHGEFFVDSGVLIELGEFFWFPSGSTTAGSCNVSTSLIAGGSGQDVNSNNINLGFDFGTDFGRLDLLYANLGGNINLRVNGVMANVANLSDLHMTPLGGAWITVQPPASSDGQLIVVGSISDFAIGGQELWIDRVCISDRALFSDDFEFGNTNAWSSTVP